MSRQKGAVANRSELAQLFGCSVMSIDAWVRKGMPYVQKGGRGVAWEYDTAACIAWSNEQAMISAIGDTSQIEIDELRRRKLCAEMIIVELEAAAAKGEVIAVGDFDKLISPMVVAYRSMLLTLPSKLVQFVDQDAMEIINDEIRVALEELATYAPEQPDEEPDNGDNPTDTD